MSPPSPDSSLGAKVGSIPSRCITGPLGASEDVMGLRNACEGPYKMTKQKDLKKKIRARAAKTGESYTEARRNTLAAKPSPTEAMKLALESWGVTIGADSKLTDADGKPITVKWSSTTETLSSFPELALDFETQVAKTVMGEVFTILFDKQLSVVGPNDDLQYLQSKALTAQKQADLAEAAEKQWLRSMAELEDKHGEMPPIGRGPRTVQHLDVGNIPPEKVAGFIEDVKNGFERLACGHLLRDPNSPEMHNARLDLRAFHGPAADAELLAAVAKEREFHTSEACLKPREPELAKGTKLTLPINTPPNLPTADIAPLLEVLKYLNSGDAHPDEIRSMVKDALDTFDQQHHDVLTALVDPDQIEDEEDWEVPAKVNGRDIMLPLKVTYEYLLQRAEMKGRPSMTYHWRNGNEANGGILCWGDEVVVKPGMIFNAAHTTSA